MARGDQLGRQWKMIQILLTSVHGGWITVKTYNVKVFTSPSLKYAFYEFGGQAIFTLRRIGRVTV